MRSWTVRRFVAALSITVAMTTAVAVADEQKAAAQAPAPVVTAPAQAAPTVPAQHVYRVYHRPVKKTFFQQVMELERRKNAWLMRTFLGR
ncbi:MAG: hypothetical protein ACKO2P_05025 [Planctomycetota bacterium]